VITSHRMWALILSWTGQSTSSLLWGILVVSVLHARPCSMTTYNKWTSVHVMTCQSPFRCDCLHHRLLEHHLWRLCLPPGNVLDDIVIILSIIHCSPLNLSFLVDCWWGILGTLLGLRLPRCTEGNCAIGVDEVVLDEGKAKAFDNCFELLWL
jgi:hypothetical protein